MAAADWVVTSAPLWVGEELTGTLRLHQKGPLPPPGHSNELEHLVALAGHLARTLHRVSTHVELPLGLVTMEYMKLRGA